MRHLLIILFSITQVQAHDWYDKNCCLNEDCRPVNCAEITLNEKGDYYIYREMRFLKEAVKPSQDNDCHACYGRNFNPLCMYLPGVS